MSTEEHPQRGNRKAQAFELLRSGQVSEARTLLSRLCESNPEDAETLLALGIADGMLGNFPAAEDSLRKTAAITPGQASVHYNLGKALKAQDKPELAAESFTTACELQPGNAAFHNDLCNVLNILGHTREALAHIQQAVALRPEIPIYQYNLGNVLNYLGLGEPALAAYQQAVSLQPDFRAALNTLGDTLMGMGRLDEAVSTYERILKAHPGDAGALVGKAAVLDKRGLFAEAGSLLDPLLSGSHINGYAAATFAGFAHHIGREPEALKLAVRLLDNPQLTTTGRARLNFALGRIHDRNCQFGKAFGHYTEGNSLRRSDFNIHEHRAYINQVIESYNVEFMRRTGRARNPSEVPVFIIGMPRSGTSLVEQILSSHPQVYGAGELELLANVADSIPQHTGKTGSYVQAVHALTPEITNQLADEYLKQLEAHAPSALRITDKMPANFMLLGLADRLFPSARVIHCQRNPLDICLSCYFQDFAGNHPYSNNLTSLGEYYREYERIMAHWRTVLRIPVLDIHYEALVSDAESVTHTLIDFCGLDRDDACLNFHKSRRTVATASYDQVRQPLYSTSVERWRNYERYIGELTDALGKRPGKA